MHNLLFVGGREDDCFWPNYKIEFVFPYIISECLSLKKRANVKYISLHKKLSPVLVGSGWKLDSANGGSNTSNRKCTLRVIQQLSEPWPRSCSTVLNKAK